MANTLAKSKRELNEVKTLLKKCENIPPYRQAYSDRTAWIMACLSELAYIKFNPSILNDKRNKLLQEKILKSLSEKKKIFLLKYIASLDYDHNEELKKLNREARDLGMKVVQTFDNNGTQAVLFSGGTFIVLAFRKAELDSIRDIKAEADARMVHCETGGKIHMGFKGAFDEVALDIQEKLDKDTKLQDMPLFITGHGLGGALATIAARELSHKGGLAACYTFGAARVGNDVWVADIKTPVYRMVNAADCVTMMPPGTEIIDVVAWLCQFVPRVGDLLRSWLLQFGGYTHAGDMRYMTNCRAGAYDDVKLLYSVSLFYRIKGWGIKKLPWSKFLADHAISIYRKKLMIIAESRNPN